MAAASHRVALLVVIGVLAITLVSAPALAHEEHGGHDTEDQGPSFWPYLFGVGSVAALGSLLAGYGEIVPREFAIGFAAGGVALATGAAIVWLV